MKLKYTATLVLGYLFSVNVIAAPSSEKIVQNANNQNSIIEEAKLLRQKYPDGIIISSLEESDLPEESKLELREKFNNLKKYGNFTKNELSHEFRNIDVFRRYKNLNRPLSFTPTQVDFLNKEFILTGKYYSGSYSKAGGHNSYVRLYEDPLSNRKVELVETYLNPENHSTVQIFTESLNKKIDDVNLTWQEVPFGKTAVYTVDFSKNQKNFSLSTMDLEQIEVEHLVSSLISQLGQ